MVWGFACSVLSGTGRVQPPCAEVVVALALGWACDTLPKNLSHSEALAEVRAKEKKQQRAKNAASQQGRGKGKGLSRVRNKPKPKAKAKARGRGRNKDAEESEEEEDEEQEQDTDSEGEGSDEQGDEDYYLAQESLFYDVRWLPDELAYNIRTLTRNGLRSRSSYGESARLSVVRPGSAEHAIQKVVYQYRLLEATQVPAIVYYFSGIVYCLPAVCRPTSPGRIPTKCQLSSKMSSVIGNCLRRP